MLPGYLKLTRIPGRFARLSMNSSISDCASARPAASAASGSFLVMAVQDRPMRLEEVAADAVGQMHAIEAQQPLALVEDAADPVGNIGFAAHFGDGHVELAIEPHHAA